ncbi:metal-dependent hydrolase [Shewanella sp. SM87]|uniref:metal-dependent hydrolase n=1 Tax=Shewanella TaxID=22 RepID=UPI0021D8CF79|nr:metal-dependent hydrolase [Shewanella sp. SM87]
MRYQGHIILGLSCWGIYAPLVNQYQSEIVIGPLKWVLALPVVALASLLPDIDHPDSKLGRRIRPISNIIAIFSHRGITHSLWAVMFMMWLLVGYSANSVIAQALIVGYMSHLLGDAVTPAGVRLFWPLGRAQRVGVPQGILMLLTVFLCFRWM